MANVKVVIDVDSGAVTFAGENVLTLTQQVKILKQELQKVPEGTKEWTLLQTKFNETKDNLDRVNVKSKELFGTFSSLPGPIGAVSGQLDNTVGVLKTFSSLKFSDIKGQFTELGKDLKGVGANIAQLTGLTTVYTTVTNASAKVLQFFGVSAQRAGVAAKGLGLAISGALAVTGLLAIVAAVQLLSLAWDYFAGKADRAAEAEKKRAESFQKGNKAALDAESAQVKRQGDLYIAQAKAKGASDEEIFKIDQQNKRLLIAAQQRYYDSIESKDSDEARAALSALKDSQVGLQTSVANHQADILKKTTDHNNQLSKAAKDKRDKDLAEIDKNAKDATNSLMTEREQARQKITDDYTIKIALAKQYGESTYVLEEAQRNAQKELADKYAKDDKEIADKILEERFKANQAAYEFQREQFEEVANLDKQRADNILLQNSIITQSWIDLGMNISSVLGTLAGVFSDNETLQKIFAVTQVAVNTASSIGKILLSGKEQQASYNDAIAAGNKSIITGALTTLSGNFVLGAAQAAGGKAAIGLAIAGKAAAKANTVQQVAVAGVVGAAQIAAILSAKKSASSSSSSGGSDSGGASTPAFAAPSIGAPQIGPSLAQSGTISGIVGQTLDQNNSQARPIRAYVVGNDITTEQQFQRRVRAAARLGG